MANTAVELLRRRMMGARGSSVDWENIAKGMVDFTTEFSIPSSVNINTNVANGFVSRKIVSIEISEGNTRMQNYFFANCSKLENVTFPSTLTTLLANCFQSCTALKNITFPATITSFGAGTFYGCTALEYVIMEATAPPTVGANMFQGCSKLTAIYVPDDSVDEYKTTSNWSTYASIIKPISQRPT